MVGSRENALDEMHLGTLRDPPTLNPKGRPRTQRLTGALEGRTRGGGGRKRSSTSAGGVSMLQNVGGQTDAVSADKRGIIAPIVHCYLAHPKAYV